MTKPWIPPTSAGMARWRRLLNDAQALVENPRGGSGALAIAVMSVKKDTYPSGKREDWATFDAWVKAADDYAAASPLERVAQQVNFAALTEQVADIMGAPLRAPPPATTPRFRADIDG